MLAAARVARVAADPAPVPAAADPGGWRGLAYFRLHGSLHVYWSDYPADVIARYAELMRPLAVDGREVWTIFDNTTAGRAPANALSLVEVLAKERFGQAPTR